MFRNLEEAHFRHRDFHGMSEFLIWRSGMEEDDMSDDGSQMVEKKRRLNLEQVRALERSFELGNKLEPERKMQLAGALGLQPRQVAIWFQNRRARWKTKQLEKDYDVLKRQLEALKADNDALKTHNNKLHTQIMAMRTRDYSKESGRTINLNKENEGSSSNGSENSCDHLNTTSTETTTGNATAAVVFPNPATDLIQLLHCSSNTRPEKIENPSPGAPEGFCNVFAGIEENPDFWPWSEQQNFH